MQNRIINIGNKLYPKELLNISNPPQKLYCLGNLELLRHNKISIVGCRNATKEGKTIAQKFSYKLAKLGFCIVSGMALGIDSSAHIGSLLAKGKTIAVLGSGTNYIYPKENIKLYKSILNNYGLIISEHEPNYKPKPEDFPKRNRIISGLSLKLIVVEASLNSGSIITANLAAEQGRSVYAVPRINYE